MHSEKSRKVEHVSQNENLAVSMYGICCIFTSLCTVYGATAGPAILSRHIVFIAGDYEPFTA